MALRREGWRNLPQPLPKLFSVLQRLMSANCFASEGCWPCGAGKVALRSYAEQYVLAIEWEAKVALQMQRSQIYPAVMTYLGDLANSLNHQETLGLLPLPRPWLAKSSALRPGADAGLPRP